MHEECVRVSFDKSCLPALKRFFDFLGLDVEEQPVLFDPIANINDTLLLVTAKPPVDFLTLAARLAAAQSTPSAVPVSDSTKPQFISRRLQPPMRSKFKRPEGEDGY